jgi:hypothetical protein
MTVPNHERKYSEAIDSTPNSTQRKIIGYLFLSLSSPEAGHFLRDFSVSTMDCIASNTINKLVKRNGMNRGPVKFVTTDSAPTNKVNGFAKIRRFSMYASLDLSAPPKFGPIGPYQLTMKFKHRAFVINSSESGAFNQREWHCQLTLDTDHETISDIGNDIVGVQILSVHSRLAPHLKMRRASRTRHWGFVKSATC